MYFFLRILPNKCMDMVFIGTLFMFFVKMLLREKKVKIFE